MNITKTNSRKNHNILSQYNHDTEKHENFISKLNNNVSSSYLDQEYNLNPKYLHCWQNERINDNA